MPPRKRALFVINSLVAGGAERVMCTLLAASDAERAEFDIELALMDREPAVYAPPAWTPVHQLDCRNSLPRTAFGLRKLMAERRPDIVLSFLTRANIATVAAARALGVPCVISERIQNSAHLGDGLSATVAKQMIRMAYPHADRIVAVSGGVARDLEAAFAIRKEKIVVIDNPVDIAAIEASARETPAINVDGPYIIGSGRLTNVKNFALLIEAFAASDYRGKLVIIGEGPERVRLEAQSARLGVGGRVILAGYAQNPFPLVKNADFFVSPSNAEGFPNALVEAMALGRAVISTNCPAGPAEILAECDLESAKTLFEARSGLLTPVDDAAALTRAINVLADPAERVAWAEKARARAQDFTVARAKDRYWAVLREVMAARAVRRS